MDDIDKIHELLKSHGAVLERTKKHKVWRFPDGRIWVVAGTPRTSQSHRNNYRDLCNFLGYHPTIRKNPDRKAKKGVNSASGFRAAGVMVEDFRDTLAAIKKYVRPAPCEGAMWLEFIPCSPWLCVLRRVFM